MTIESGMVKLVLGIEGAKIVTIDPSKTHYMCLKSEELKVCIVFILSLKMIGNIVSKLKYSRFY